MKWKLVFKDHNSLPAPEQWGVYDSKQDALNAACEKMKVLRVEVVRIEEPDGNEVGLAEIKAHCGP
jgi:hypothetical protein